jgi:DNA-binding IclR family transcriptional regulator
MLAEMLASENTLTSIGRPIMLRLRDQLGHTITLARVSGGVANMVDALEGNGLINIGVRVGRDLPLHANAGGKLVLASARPRFMPRSSGSRSNAIPNIRSPISARCARRSSACASRAGPMRPRNS